MDDRLIGIADDRTRLNGRQVNTQIWFLVLCQFVFILKILKFGKKGDLKLELKLDLKVEQN